jgi:transcription initiation factor TFIIH subunit 4
MASTASQRALDYLEQLPGTTFTKLYTQPSTSLAIFRRMLPHLAKTIVMGMLYMPGPLPAGDLDAWVKPDAESLSARDRALSILQRLRILVEEEGRSYRLRAEFSKSLRLALTGGGNHRSFGVPCSEPDDKPVTVDYLDAFARKQWEAILYYVVGSANAGLGGGENISEGTRQLLQRGEFVTVQGRRAMITQAGFTFLLQEINAQIWTLLIVYLEVSAAVQLPQPIPQGRSSVDANRSRQLQMDPTDVLSFLFTLGSLELGISYSTSNLTPTQQQMLEDLADFGLVYRRSETADRYYPTRLATTLTSDAPALPNSSLTATTTSTTAGGEAATADGERGYIIVETNYRLYAYTNSPLLISVLSLFVQLQTRYPNLIAGKITKNSVLSAIGMGITSQQIIAYLTTHAHPILRRQHPILPPTVVDQIRLWQIEGERMTSWQGFLIKMEAGSTREEYDKAVQYAEALGVLRKEFRTKGFFFVSRMEQMASYFRSQALKKKQQQQAAEAAQTAQAQAEKSRV